MHTLRIRNTYCFSTWLYECVSKLGYTYVACRVNFSFKSAAHSQKSDRTDIENNGPFHSSRGYLLACNRGQHQFNLGPVSVGFVENKVTAGQVSLQVRRFSQFDMLPSIIYIHSFIEHRS